ncbi:MULTISPECIES: hypothetical protein [unclassified Achromobacter]|uniref:hypothetical protein n=1 Tax=unclassified Achromobacter TaxID=2626865 RepID=UPI00117859D3|nr:MULTISPECIES: hypothetical protein [unclassified Achromobacter]
MRGVSVPSAAIAPNAPNAQARTFPQPLHHPVMKLKDPSTTLKTFSPAFRWRLASFLVEPDGDRSMWWNRRQEQGSSGIWGHLYALYLPLRLQEKMLSPAWEAEKAAAVANGFMAPTRLEPGAHKRATRAIRAVAARHESDDGSAT